MTTKAHSSTDAQNLDTTSVDILIKHPLFSSKEIPFFVKYTRNRVKIQNRIPSARVFADGLAKQ